MPPVGAVSEEKVAVAFTSDGKCLLLASDVRVPLVLDAASGKVVRPLGTDSEWFAPAVSIWRHGATDNAVTSSMGNLYVWEPLNGNAVFSLKGAGREVLSLQVARDVPRIALGVNIGPDEYTFGTGGMLVRELPSGRIILDARQFQSPVWEIAISPRGQYVVGASEGELACWSIDRKERLWSIMAVRGVLAMSPDGTTLVFGTGSRLVLCDVRSGTPLSEATYGSRTVSTVAFAADGTSVVTGTREGVIGVWKLLRGQAAGSSAAAFDDGLHVHIATPKKR